jgi:hypothetical protein
VSRASATDLLVLHAVRLTGFAEVAAVARRYRLDEIETADRLDDARARGWVEHSGFAGLTGWSLTDAGRVENEQRLACELAATGRAKEVRAIHRGFLPLNGLLQQACTDWQLRPTGGDRLAANDHSDQAWDDGVLDELAAVNRALGSLNARLVDVLARFRGYDARFAGALQRAQAGEGRWVDGTDVDSCHRVWFELHEDLIATLGIDRRTEQSEVSTT